MNTPFFLFIFLPYVTFSQPDTFKDKRDNEKYKYTTFNGLKWMTEKHEVQKPGNPIFRISAKNVRT